MAESDRRAVPEPDRSEMSCAQRLPSVVPREFGRVREEEAGLVLVIDDEPLLLRALRRILRAEGCRVQIADSPAAAQDGLSDPALDVVLVDLALGVHSGLEILDRVKRERPEVEVIVMTGHASIESAVACMRRGATDYLVKPFEDLQRVRATVRRALERSRLGRRNSQLESDTTGPEENPPWVADASAMRPLLRTIRSLQRGESPVLLCGESGTGLELLARVIHAESPLADGPFVLVDCAALSETSFERELLGPRRRSQESRGHGGLLGAAVGGTLFLDELGLIPAPVQAALLRVLRPDPLGDGRGRSRLPVTPRLISASRRDPRSLVRTGELRTDLCYRLDVVRLDVPPLRERLGDLPLLVHHFIRKHARPFCPVRGIETDALELLQAYDWPGNVRELENVVESALALAPGPRLRCADLHLAPRIAEAPVALPCSPDEIALSLAAYERSALERALSECGGDVRAAARCLGIGRSTFYRKLSRHHLTAREPGPSPVS